MTTQIERDRHLRDLVNTWSADNCRMVGFECAEELAFVLNQYPATDALSAVEPDAYLHTIIDCTDGEEDLALSFNADSFPFDCLEQYKSVKVQPLYTHPPSVSDGERYRWLRDKNTNASKVIEKITGELPSGFPIYELKSEDELDAAIDKAIAAATRGRCDEKT